MARSASPGRENTRRSLKVVSRQWLSGQAASKVPEINDRVSGQRPTALQRTQIHKNAANLRVVICQCSTASASSLRASRPSRPSLFVLFFFVLRLQLLVHPHCNCVSDATTQRQLPTRCCPPRSPAAIGGDQSQRRGDPPFRPSLVTPLATCASPKIPPTRIPL